MTAVTKPKPGSKEPDELCNALKKNGELCRNRAGHGTDHLGVGRCLTHGGGNRAYGKHLNLQRIKQQAMAYGDENDIDPLSSLLGEIRWTDGHVQWLREQIQLGPDDDSLLRRRRELLALYSQERKHLITACEHAVRLGIAERHVRLREEEVKLLASIAVAALDEVGLPHETRRAVLKAMAAQVHARRGARVSLPAIPPANPIIETSTADEPGDDDDDDDEGTAAATPSRARIIA